MTTAEKTQHVGTLTCGHVSPESYWPCASRAGHDSFHQNAAKAWPRRPDDDCPPEGTTAEMANLVADAARYRWLRETFNAAKGGASLTVNEELGVYEKPEPGKEVRIQWYPNTPVGFNLAEAATLDEAIAEARAE